MDDDSFEQLFVPVMDTIMARYQPDAIVLQSGELLRTVQYLATSDVVIWVSCQAMIPSDFSYEYAAASASARRCS